MAYSAPGIDLSFVAAEDLSGHQYRFVVQAGDDDVQMSDAATDWPVGILQNNPEAGETAVVRVSGVSKLAAGAGGLSRADKVKIEHVSASDNGKGIAADTAADNVRARVLMAAPSEDDVATVLLVDAVVHA